VKWREEQSGERVKRERELVRHRKKSEVERIEEWAGNGEKE
jgi:hypothetical protein